METNIDFKKIWNKQKVETPKMEILYTKANKLKSRSFLRLILVNITLILTITFRFKSKLILSTLCKILYFKV